MGILCGDSFSFRFTVVFLSCYLLTLVLILVRIDRPEPIVSCFICKCLFVSFDSLEADLEMGADFGSLGDARKIASRLEQLAQHSGDTPGEREVAPRVWEILLDNKIKFYWKSSRLIISMERIQGL